MCFGGGHDLLTRCLPRTLRSIRVIRSESGTPGSGPGQHGPQPGASESSESLGPLPGLQRGPVRATARRIRVAGLGGESGGAPGRLPPPPPITGQDRPAPAGVRAGPGRLADSDHHRGRVGGRAPNRISRVVARRARASGASPRLRRSESIRVLGPPRRAKWPASAASVTVALPAREAVGRCCGPAAARERLSRWLAVPAGASRAVSRAPAQSVPGAGSRAKICYVCRALLRG